MNRRMMIFGPLVAVVVLGLWYMALWSPRQQAIATEKKRVTEAAAQRANLETQLNRLRELKREEPRNRERLEKLRTAVPDQPSLAEFILDANSAASRAGIKFMSFTPSPPTGGGPGQPASVNVQVVISGKYNQVLTFLDYLEELPRILVVDQLSLTPDQSADPTLNVSFTGRLFVNATAPAPAPAAPAPGAPATPAASATPAPATPAAPATPTPATPTPGGP